MTHKVWNKSFFFNQRYEISQTVKKVHMDWEQAKGHAKLNVNIGLPFHKIMANLTETQTIP